MRFDILYSSLFTNFRRKPFELAPPLSTKAPQMVNQDPSSRRFKPHLFLTPDPLHLLFHTNILAACLRSLRILCLCLLHDSEPSRGTAKFTERNGGRLKICGHKDGSNQMCHKILPNPEALSLKFKTICRAVHSVQQIRNIQVVEQDCVCIMGGEGRSSCEKMQMLRVAMIRGRKTYAQAAPIVLQEHARWGYPCFSRNTLLVKKLHSLFRLLYKFYVAPYIIAQESNA